MIGDHPVGSYAKTDVKKFKEVLFNIPPNAHKKAAYKGLGFVAIAEKASATGDQKPAVKKRGKENGWSFVDVFLGAEELR